ncbi:MAG: hypothetical protein ABIO70_11720 [Pseudomonadota bacterium]
MRPAPALLLLAGRCGPAVQPDDTDTAPPGPPVADLSAAVDEVIGSLVRVTWEQREACRGAVAARVEGGDWRRGPEVEREVGDRGQLVVGLPYGATVALRLEEDCGEGALISEVLTIATAPLPTGLPAPALLHREADAEDPEMHYLLLSTDSREDAPDPDACWTVLVDRAGAVVWALASPVNRRTMSPRVALDSQGLLIDHNSFWGIFDGGAASQVQRVGLDGEELALYDTPGLHHGLTELGDGTVAWAAADGMTENLMLLHPDGSQEALWSCASLHQQVGSLQPCAANTLLWDAATDTFLFSFFSTDTVAQIDASTGETLRWFGQLPGAWAFDPEESAFWWQHGAALTAAGTLLVSTRVAEHTDETAVREYALDEGTSTLRQVWAFGEDEGIYGAELGEAWRLEGGNTLHNLGTAQRIREITPAGRVVWDLGWTRGSFVGHSEPIGDLYALLPEGGAR